MGQATGEREGERRGNGRGDDKKEERGGVVKRKDVERQTRGE